MRILRMGGVLLAAMAVMAVGASAASALEFKSSSYPVVVEGSQVGQHTFTVDGQNVNCSTADFITPSQGGPATSIDVFATYEGCKAFGFVNATVNMNSCNYEFNEPAGNPIVGSVDVECSSASIIEIKASTAFGTCVVTVGAQNGLNKNTYANNAGDVEIDTNVTGIKATVVTDTGICPLSGTGTRENAVYIGDSIASGNAGQNISVE